MAVCMTAMTSDIYAHGRSDPEYYLPSHTKVRQILDSVPTVPMRRLGRFSCSAFYPAATHLYCQDGVPFIRCVDIVNTPVLAPDQPYARLPAAFVSDHSSIRCLKPGDIVISKVGTPCYAGLLADDMPQVALTRTVLGMSEIDKDLVNPFYLLAFLRSRYGFDQLMRERELTIQYQLTLDRTRKVRVFMPATSAQDNVAALMRGHYAEDRQSVDAYAQATKLFDAELGLDSVQFERQDTAQYSVVGLWDTSAARRIDAQCFSPEAIFYDSLLSQRAECVRLGRLLHAAEKGRQHSEVEGGTADYCSIMHLDRGEIVDPSRANPANGTPYATKDDLLLAITGATIGKVGIVHRYESLVFSGDLLCLKTNGEISPHYLLLALGHHLGQVQFTRWITGSTNGHLSPRDVGRMLVPRLSSKVEGKIAALVAESLDRRIESERLLKQAKARVEQLIEEAIER